MSNPRVERSSDGRVRMQITQGTRPSMGPIRIGVLAVRSEHAQGGPSARVQISLHRELGAVSPGVMTLAVGAPVRIEPLGELELIEIIDADSQGLATDAPVDPDARTRASILVELRPS